MTLSPNVKRGPPPPRETPSAGARPSSRPRDVRKSRNSPFGGMNITSAPRTAEAQRNKISVAEQRRQARHVKGGAKKPDDKSKDPMKALKMQRRLSNVSYEKRGKIKESIAQRDEFDSFGLLPAIHEAIVPQALSGRADAVPSPIQRVAIPALLGLEENKSRKRRAEVPQEGMQQFLLAAETGSGKTLAYVLPIVDAIKRAEIAEREAEAREGEREDRQRRKEAKNRLFQVEPPDAEEPDPSSARPRAIILVPTSELVDQVGAVIKSLAHSEVPVCTAERQLLRRGYPLAPLFKKRHRRRGIDTSSPVQHHRKRPKHPLPRLSSRHRRSRLSPRPLLLPNDILHHRPRESKPQATRLLLRHHPAKPGLLPHKTLPRDATLGHTESARHPSQSTAQCRRCGESAVPGQPKSRLRSSDMGYWQGRHGRW